MTVRETLEEYVLRVRRPLIVFAHLGVFAASYFLAFLIRFEFRFPEAYVDVIPLTLTFAVGVKAVVFFLFRQYSGWWRYVGMSDLIELIKAAVISGAVLTGLIFLADQRSFPRSVLLLDGMLTIGLLAAARVSVRLIRERVLGRTIGESGARTLVVGTGMSAESLIREAQRNPGLGVDTVAIVSEDDRHRGTRVSNIPVVSTVETLPKAVADYSVEQVIIALDGTNNDVLRRVVTQCTSADVKYRVLPAAEQLVSGQVSISRLREVDLQDLLGRPPARLDNSVIASLISGETVLITGAGGSIGSELCRQVARFGAGQLVLVEQAENPLFHLERELVHEFDNIRLEAIVADIYDGDRLSRVMERYRPRLVLHAAAHKHVPLMEANPSEAIKNNILGTLNVIRAAQTAEVERCVLISTDKAVNPTSVMGASKRFAEMLMQSLEDESSTVLAAVRFGNVLGSNGSVIPIFKKQIAAGGPVTVTHPDMRRYFMTIPEATQLVLQAATFAQGEDIFVLDMGKPVYIVDVARDLIRLSGLEPERDIEIVFSGIRPGEKLFEELAGDSEEKCETNHDRIFRVAMPPPEARVVLEAVDDLHLLARTGAPSAHIRKAIFELLDALERRKSLEDVKRLADNIIELRNMLSNA